MTLIPFLYMGPQELLPDLRLDALIPELVLPHQLGVALAERSFAFMLFDGRQAVVRELLTTLDLPTTIPLLVLASPPYEQELYRRFQAREILDLIDPAWLPASLAKSLVLHPQLDAASSLANFGPSQLISLNSQALSQIYHQLQGPVTALEGYLEILQSEPLSQANVQQILSQLRHCVVRLRHYFNSLHLLSLVSVQAEGIKARPFLFHQLVHEFHRDVEPFLDMSALAWEFQLDAHEDLVLADPHALLNVLLILLDLAQRTVSGKNGLVSLQTGNLSAERLKARAGAEMDASQFQTSFLEQEPVAGRRYLQITLQFRGVTAELSQALIYAFVGGPMPGRCAPEILLGTYLLYRTLKAGQSWIYLESQPGFGLLFSFVLPLHLMPERAD
ncbi:MAG: hypothetical protein CVV27_17345 [Candidatus Melainabacteria bacterium HGW-Melainabacteria-1]|nr:MAG: hypothetical protein CVV27_17345 [Candidatus Melainabacteria bacterium HGW-Melainabacteria-1]